MHLVISLHLCTWAPHHDVILNYTREEATAITNVLIKSG